LERQLTLAGLPAEQIATWIAQERADMASDDGFLTNRQPQPEQISFGVPLIEDIYFDGREGDDIDGEEIEEEFIE